MTRDVLTGLEDVPYAAEPPPAERPGRSPAKLDPETRRRIGRNLRTLYAPVLAQPIPERFTALLDALAAPTERETS